MSGKKITMKNPKSKPANPDEWVSNREGTKRMTIDLPISMHTQLKIESAKTGATMGDIIRTCLKEKLKA